VFGALAEHMLAPVAINATPTGFTPFSGPRGADRCSRGGCAPRQ